MRLDISSVQESANKLQEQINQLLEKARAEGQVMFSDACKKLFDAYPELKAFRWTQYTPYFCDGDPCEFGVNECHVAFNIEVPENVGDSWRDDGFYEVRTYRDRVEPFAEIQDAVDTVRGLLSEDTCLSLFGDHVEVTVDRDGASTSEYSHD